MSTLTFVVDTNLSLGRQARLARVARGWSQTVLASIAKCRQLQVSLLERDLPIEKEARKRILTALQLEDEK